ncbi:MAG: hypothetical protein TYPL_1020 [Candidatus Tyloplasma litorale]|nr:MAG: hypothetical protein TYPL_1020 [Mycoplasmatales bacterium]
MFFIAFVLLLIFILLIIFNFLIYKLTIFYERNNRINKIQKNLNFFPPHKLKLKINSLPKKIKNNSEIKIIIERINELENIDYKKIKLKLNLMKKISSKTSPKSFALFNLSYNKIIKMIIEYEKNYLEIRFSSIEATSEIQIYKSIVVLLKEKLDYFYNKISSSEEKIIKDSEILKNDLFKIKINIKSLEKIIFNSDGKIFNDEFDSLKEILFKNIKKFIINFKFLEIYLAYVKDKLIIEEEKIINFLKDNEKELSNIKDQIEKTLLDIKEYKIKLKNELINLNIDNSKIILKKMNEFLNKIKIKTYLNYEYTNFLKKEYKDVNLFKKYVEENNSLFLEEIKKQRFANQEEIFNEMDILKEEFNKKYIKFNKMISIEKNEFDWIKLQIFLLETIISFKKYKDFLKEKLKDISQINSINNMVNKKILNMNIFLLKIEFNISKLDGILKEELEKKYKLLEGNFYLIREKFKNNKRFLNKNEISLINELYFNIEELLSISISNSFEIFFIEECIIFLNRYKGNNFKLDEKLDLIYLKFKNEKYSESLKKIKEVINFYGIK